MKNKKINIRPHLEGFTAYSSARDEFMGNARVFLDANENPYGASFRGVTALNRYPDPRQSALKEMISLSEDIPERNIFLGNGSDEIIDLVIRTTCTPGRDNVIVNVPGYGMYGVLAGVNDIAVREVPLDSAYQPDTTKILSLVDDNTRIIFICSPNNPTGNMAEEKRVTQLVNEFNGLIVIDEAYIDFASAGGFKSLLAEHTNIIILKTFSKARGMAGARLGMAFGPGQLIDIMNAIKLPYNISSLTIEAATASLRREEVWRQQVERIKADRSRLAVELVKIDTVKKVYPSDANFLLVKVSDPLSLYLFLAQRGIVIRDRSMIAGCEGSVRITVGTSPENERLLEAIREFSGKGNEQQDTGGDGKSRTARVTRETSILVDINLYGGGISDIQTGSGFFDHMLEQLAFHSGIDMLVRVSGDIETGMHHIMEDVAITLGESFAAALGDRSGITRYGFTLPMDDSLAVVAIDMGGRIYLNWDVSFKGEMTGDLPTEMYDHFFRSFAGSARCTINIKAEGENDHHMAEAIFKSFAHAIAEAVIKDGRGRIASTKGMVSSGSF